MATSATPSTQLDREYLPIRAKILEIAAALDRIQRRDTAERSDPRWDQIQAGVAILQEATQDRAERVQLLFSREYDRSWRETFDIPR